LYKYWELLVEGTKLFLVLLAVASLILIITLVICLYVWEKYSTKREYFTPTRIGKRFEIERKKFVQPALLREIFRRLRCWFLLLILLPLMRSEEYVVRRGWFTAGYSYYRRFLIYRLCEDYYLRCWLRKRGY
jgi:hypothetical protein